MHKATDELQAGADTDTIQPRIKQVMKHTHNLTVLECVSESNLRLLQMLQMTTDLFWWLGILQVTMVNKDNDNNYGDLR